ncbi:hypothetical protein EON73_01235 [bacterium]|nr:MAG: hypothetical protein EON73_01235 [bacterium]
MVVLTVRTDELDDSLIDKVKQRYGVSTSAKALISVVRNCLNSEIELAELKNEKLKLQHQVQDYQSANLDLSKGLSHLTKLTNNTL